MHQNILWICIIVHVHDREFIFPNPHLHTLIGSVACNFASCRGVHAWKLLVVNLRNIESRSICRNMELDRHYEVWKSPQENYSAHHKGIVDINLLSFRLLARFEIHLVFEGRIGSSARKAWLGSSLYTQKKSRGDT